MPPESMVVEHTTKEHIDAQKSGFSDPAHHNYRLKLVLKELLSVSTHSNQQGRESLSQYKLLAKLLSHIQHT